jgi:hypothetical protein
MSEKLYVSENVRYVIKVEQIHPGRDHSLVVKGKETVIELWTKDLLQSSSYAQSSFNTCTV